MSVSNINSNLSALLNKAYSTDSSAATSSEAVKEMLKEATSADNSTSSTSVTLGASGTPTETYTAQGLLQQMRQYQLSNTSLLFGSGDSESDSNMFSSVTGSEGSTSGDSSTDIEAMSQDWAKTIANDPSKAAVMVESSKNKSLTTIFGGS